MGGSLAKSMHLLSEFTRYVRVGVEARRWAEMLYNRPLSRGVDYPINNIKANKSSLADKNAGGLLKQKGEIENRRKRKSALIG